MADAQTPTPAQLLAFLHGAGEIDGVSFGDRHPTLPGAFWWRRHLPMLAAKAPAQQAVPVATIRTWHKGADQHAELIDWHLVLDELPDGDHVLYTRPAPSHRAVMQQALDALEHHVEQTRPIERTTVAIASLRAALSATMEKKHAT